ncbi:MAG TPA: lipid-binding SYLF domain-containing protein [Terriglobia bacterium]|jgi:lipid-binding SYLF domain-containing protein|nr:lipid-binding SYLF domain-containing protein [Terriglobia bacterium]
MKHFAVTILILSFSLDIAQAKLTKEAARLEDAAVTMSEIMSTPENSIPKDLLDKAVCVGIIPSEKKLAFGFGGSYGRGALLCRQGGDGTWGAPSMIALHGGSFGFQLGGSATDVVFIVMNPGGIRKLLKSKGELGADASVAAGPVGRTASGSTDLLITAEILTYSRSRGLFAGVSLKGAAITQDEKANEHLYGHKVDPQAILLENKVAVPAEAKSLVEVLDRFSPHGGEKFPTS